MKVYMPYDDRSDETTAGYRQILGNLQASIEYLTSDNMGIVGDFNVDPGRGRLWHFLYDFLQSNELVCADLNLPVDSCTYISPAHNTTAWLDHVITNKNTSIKNIEICYDIAVYDHFPVSFSLEVYRSSGSASADIRMNFDIRIRNISCGCHADIANNKRIIFSYS